MSELRIVAGDITTLEVDVVVNAANSGLLGGGGVDGAIHRAGGPEILAECRRLRETTLRDGLPSGDAVATTAGRMPARWVVHTVGPVYLTSEDRSATLRSAYTRSLEVAAKLGARSVAFPLISAGVYGWPVHDAVHQAVTAIRASPAGIEATLTGDERLLRCRVEGRGRLSLCGSATAMGRRLAPKSSTLPNTGFPAGSRISHRHSGRRRSRASSAARAGLARGQRLGADDGQELQLLVTAGPWRGREDQ